MIIATDRSKASDKRLCHSSDSDDRSFLFRMSNDLMRSVRSYLDIKSICQIDIAVSNAAERDVWLTGLSLNYLVTFSEHKHCKESIRWLAKRGIRLESLKIKDIKFETNRIDGSALFGLKMSSLKCINVQGCSIGDEEVLLMANGCPHLVEICLSGCDGITNASLITLGVNCRHLISIDIGRCKNITDEGLEGCHLLTNINLSSCEKITDIGTLALAGSCPILQQAERLIVIT